MRKQSAVVALLMLLFAGLGSSALLTRALAQPKARTAIQQEKRIGPTPTPRWYWSWLQWRLGEGFARRRPLQPSLRPKQAPHHIPAWAWRRLHFFLLARDQRALADAGNKGHRGHTTTTSTTTTTTSVTTSTTTASSTTTTTSSGTKTYDQAIAYTQTRPGFTPTREIDVTDAASLKKAIANLQAGDLVKATADFTVSQGGTANALVIKARLSSPAVIDLSQHMVNFVYTGGSNYNAVWLNDPKNVWIYGGDASTADTGGDCIKVNGADYVTWWGFTAHDCGASGFSALTTAPITHNDFQGEIWKVGQNLQWDPHTEKGTGLHGAILWDANTGYPFSENRLAFYAHDIPAGACVELGNDQSSSQAGGNVLYEKCVNETEVALSQTGGNGLQLWGDTDTLGLDVKYLEVDNAQGRALDAQGLYSGQTLGGVTVEDGTASNTNLNTKLNEPSNELPWDWRGSVVYQQVLPAP